MLTWHIVGPQHIIAVWFCCSEANARVLPEAALGMWVQKARSGPGSLHHLFLCLGWGAPHLPLKSKSLVASQEFPL